MSDAAVLETDERGGDAEGEIRIVATEPDGYVADDSTSMNRAEGAVSNGADDAGSSEGKAGVMADNVGDGTLYTLTEVSELTKISMPTLQRYKKNYQDRIPSVGQGRTQRYPAEALPIFEELKEENMKRRGRPRKNAVDRAPVVQRRRPIGRQTKAEDANELLTLKQIEEMTGISYPTLLRYVKTNLDRIPHSGSGRRRRYPAEAVEIFKTLREESRRGRRAAKAGPVQVGVTPAVRRAPDAGVSSSVVAELTQRVKELQKAQQQLQRQVQKLEKEMQKPFKVTVKRA
ncbi:MAG: helix-turn-helix domain-containing protein [Acidobacteriota bacterium]